MTHSKLAASALGAVALLFLAGCSAGTGNEAAPTEHPTIAFLLPCASSAARWDSQDRPAFEEEVKKLDPEAKTIISDAQCSSPRQIAQAEAAITAGANVIVIAPWENSAGAAVAAKAAAAGIPVVSYDSLISGADAAFYVSYDLVAVGRLQGEYIVENADEGARVALINGAPSTAPAAAFLEGAMTELDPAFTSGTLTKVYETDTPDWDPAKAQAEMDQALTSTSNGIDAVLAPNDGLAGGVIASLEKQNLAGKVIVTGQDGTDAGLQRILMGTQSMTVYKDVLKQARSAADVAYAIVTKGTDAAVKEFSSGTTDNGTAKIPSLLLTPIVMTASNIDIAVEAGSTTWDNICAGIPAEKCPAP